MTITPANMKGKVIIVRNVKFMHNAVLLGIGTIQKLKLEDVTYEVDYQAIQYKRSRTLKWLKKLRIDSNKVL